MAERNVKYSDVDGWVNGVYVGTKAFDTDTHTSVILQDALLTAEESGDGYNHIRETKRKTRMIPDALLFKEGTSDSSMREPFESEITEGSNEEEESTG